MKTDRIIIGLLFSLLITLTVIIFNVNPEENKELSEKRSKLFIECVELSTRNLSVNNVSNIILSCRDSVLAIER